MAETRIQGAVSVSGEIQFKQANTLMKTSGVVGCCSCTSSNSLIHTVTLHESWLSLLGWTTNWTAKVLCFIAKNGR